MPLHEIRLAALIREWADETLLAEALLFPDAGCFHREPGEARRMLLRRVREVVKRLPPGQIYRRRLAELPTVRAIQLEIAPLRDDLYRRDQATLQLHYVAWRHLEDAAIAYVPALGIEVVAKDEQQLAEQLEPQIRLALSRLGAPRSLRALVHLEQQRSLRVRTLRLKIKLPTLKEAALAERDKKEDEKSTLKETATDLRQQPLRPVHGREEELARLVKLLTARTPQSVLLVGPSGVGKTALVQELARRRNEFALGQTPLWSTSGSRLIAGMSGFGMWQERCQKLLREASKTQAIIHFDNLIELIEVGKGGGNTQGIASLLRPAIARGSLLAIVECLPEQLAIIERNDPQLLEAFTQLPIAEPAAEQTRLILAKEAETFRPAKPTPILPDALATLDRLHRRYATYSAAPGRPLRFLRNLLEDRPEEAPPLTARDVTAAFSHETGLPLFMLDDALPLDLAQTAEWFRERVIGQVEPVQMVVEMLGSVKAGLTRGGKPIASLLFIGPTGVGKTEMAKSLAEFLYQDASRMIRFDMSEYHHPAAVERLIGGASAAQGLLTQKVRDQPFMVVLLDEFEKAHPLFFDVLLQVLGEGRLTDGAGRVADFTNSVVIMTSNLGAESFRQSTFGFAGEDHGAAAVQHFERETKAFLRPEMFNRLDRIIPFTPLSRETIARVAQREIGKVLSRPGLKFRGVPLQVSETAVALLAEQGYDPRYGARPLKRAIEQQLVAPLAATLNSYTHDVFLDCRADVHEGRLQVDVTAQPKGELGNGVENYYNHRELGRLQDLRRKLQLLDRSAVVLRLRNEIYRLRQAQEQRRKKALRRGRPDKFEFTPEQAQLLAQEGMLTRATELLQQALALEDRMVADFLSERPIDRPAVEATRELLEEELNELLFQMYLAQEAKRAILSLAIFGEELDRIFELCSAYEAVCKEHGANISRYWLKHYDPQLDVPTQFQARGTVPPSALMPVMHLKNRPAGVDAPVNKVVDVFAPPPELFTSPQTPLLGVALQIVGSRPVSLLESETGRHEFSRAVGKPENCFIEARTSRLLSYDPPADIGKPTAWQDLPLRRAYYGAREDCWDFATRRYYSYKHRELAAAIAPAVVDNLQTRIWSLLEGWS